MTAPHARAGRPGLVLGGVAIAFTSLYLAAGALVPLLVLYQEKWGLSAALLTLAFAVFALGFLAALLTLGSLSDHLGRRPVLVGALVLQLASNVVFLVAPDIGWVIAGRILQGFATGAATTAFTAALVEVAPPDRKGLGAALGGVGLTGGLAVGSLLAGLALQLTTHANSIVFVALVVITVLGIGVIALSPETATRTPGILRALIPRVAVPPSARREFAAAAPAIAAIWMIAALSGGLAPSFVRTVFLLNSGLLNGLAGFVAPAASAAVGLVFGATDSRRAMRIGIQASIVGSICIVGGVWAGILTLMIVGQVIAGAGFGASFTAALRLVLPLVKGHQRAGVVAAIFLVAYTAFGAPIVVAGQLAGRYGSVPTVIAFGAATVLLALVSLAAQQNLTRLTRMPAAQSN